VSPRCPVCGCGERYYAFVAGSERFDKCRDCGLLSHSAVGGQEASPYRADHASLETPALLGQLLDTLRQYTAGGAARLGVVGPRWQALVEPGRERGFQVAHIDLAAPGPAEQDALLVIDALEDAEAPAEFLEGLRARLRPGGALVVLTRQLLRAGTRYGGQVLERLQRHSFSDENLQALLWKAGFGEVFLAHRDSSEAALQAAGWQTARGIALCRMHERRPLPRLSVVTPVFNEAATVGQVLDLLASKQVHGLELEVVVVESNSSDGSREIVRRYEGHPRFKVVLEDRPRGKGHAVRAGLAHVTGDVVLIQDADLEYDFLDYAMLLRPVVDGRVAFVLGSRHAGHWKIRKFARHWLADLMNLAHWALVFLMNRLYGAAMTDPFTMFKVFRADCLTGLDFECDRFDFDIELVCKLLRKGYTPLEIPVNYQARSFEEGKKVQIFRDPITWLRAMWRYRSRPVVRFPAPAGPRPAAPHQGSRA
jgi:hypothetical protein